MKKLILFFLCWQSLFLFAQQPQHFLTNRWKWIDSGDTLTSAISGAMNAPQFGKVDMDLDGVEDIVLFDREDYSFTPYLHRIKNGQVVYEYNPRYKENFENCDCEHWAVFQDMNCDGVNDLFCCNYLGHFRVYKSGIENAKRVFKPSQGQSLMYAQPGFIPPVAPISVLITDYPAVADADGDGDVDIISFSYFSNYVDYYKNLAIEQTGKCDTMIMKLESQCWGHFYESNSANTAFLHDTSSTGLCPFPAGFSPTYVQSNQNQPFPSDPDPIRHAGSTALMLNLDGDSLQDLMVGDVSYNKVYALYNKGAKWHSYVTSVDTAYPQYNVAVEVKTFPATFYIDIDDDGKKDLIASPNQMQGSNNMKSVSVHKNIGQNDHPNFQYQTHGFLQNSCLEFGSFANPAFFDFNNDGLEDVLVGNGFYEDGDPSTSKYAAFSLYRNIGSTIYPMYELEDDDFLGIKTNPTYANLRHLTPTFADIDNDGRKDLFFGNATGTIYYFRNVNNNFIFLTSQFAGIDVGGMSAPTFFDIDNDNDLDLFVGNEAGYVWYFKNNGSTSSFQFDSVTNKYGYVRASDYVPNTNGYAKPVFLDYNNDGITEFLLGATSGVIEIYDQLPLNAQDSLNLVDTLFHYDFGSYAAPAVAKVDSSGDWSYLVGNARGGLQVFAIQEPDTTQPIIPIVPPVMPQTETIIYPNPTESEFTISFADTGSYQLKLLNQLGQVVFETQFQGYQKTIKLSTLLSRGIYYLQIFDKKGRREVKKVWLY
ncbi:MAG: FG-GAP-like repeat-containing protein [Bacteroidia bacterium]